MARIYESGPNGVSFQIGEWTLHLYAGREAGSLPSADASITLYQRRDDDRRGIEIADDRLTPIDPDFAGVLLMALGQDRIGWPLEDGDE